MSAEVQRTIRCVLMRVGTSKAVYFKLNDLPSDPLSRDRLLLAAMGSPDPTQIDGLGGGTVSTSKIAILGPSARDDADIDYTFGQVSLTQAAIDYSGNCGNCSSGVGPFAVDEGMVPVSEPVTLVRVYNTNTKKLLLQYVPVTNGRAQVDGDYSIDGVPGTGARIDIDFKDAVGSVTGKLLPTGRVRDVLDVPELGKIEVSILDFGNPVVFFHASSVGATGGETRPDINADKALLARIEAIRSVAAKAIGLIAPHQIAALESPMRPLVVYVAEAGDYKDYVSGNPISKDQIDFVARNLMNQAAIETFAATAGLCTAIASVVPGTVVHEVARRKSPDSDWIRFGHARGVTESRVAVSGAGANVAVDLAIMPRTARRLMDGHVFVRPSTL
jgi:2-methylaconitate cis-trans-isomerase PrpF